MNDLAKRLKEYRQRKNLTVTQVARSLDIAISTYREWENGRAIKGEPYVKLAKLFDVSVYELMTGDQGNLSKAFDELKHVKNSLFRLEKELESTI